MEQPNGGEDDEQDLHENARSSLEVSDRKWLFVEYLLDTAGDDAHGGREEEDAKAQSVDPGISIPRSLLQLIYE